MRRGDVIRPLVLLLAAQLPLGAVPGGLNLCVANDGHTAVELAHGTAPCMREAQRRHSSVRGEPQEIERPPCRDVSLRPADPYRPPDPARPASARPAAAAMLPHGLRPPPRHSHSTRISAPPLDTHVPRALRTVVLVL